MFSPSNFWAQGLGTLPFVPFFNRNGAPGPLAALGGAAASQPGGNVPLHPTAEGSQRRVAAPQPAAPRGQLALRLTHQVTIKQPEDVGPAGGGTGAVPPPGPRRSPRCRPRRRAARGAGASPPIRAWRDLTLNSGTCLKLLPPTHKSHSRSVSLIKKEITTLLLKREQTRWQELTKCHIIC